jgi:DEAD/DEAH box helicase domain-containing protein
MPLKIFLSRNFDHTHERLLFEELGNKLYSTFHQSPDLYVCIGNLHVEGKELDAVLIKKDAITVIEFKNYGGALTFHENGDWPITVIQNGNANTVSVKGGANENPYQQVRRNKFALLSTLNLFGNFKQTNLGHISGIVLFSKNIDFDPFSISDKLASWFHITDLAHVIQKINQITSTGINLSNQEIGRFQKLFNLSFENEVPVPEEFQTLIYPEEEEIVEEQELENLATMEDETSDYLKIERSIEDLVEVCGYSIVHRDVLAERASETLSIDDLNLSIGAKNYLNTAVGGEIYRHQHKALELLRTNKEEVNNVCLATSTSSGKSLVFYAQAIEILSKNPTAKIIAIYPLKALGYQQEEKWNQAFQMSGLNLKAGRIDGTVGANQRNAILNSCNVVVVTPDVVHSWFLSNLSQKTVKTFFRNLALVVLDEVHVYRGVFGSNSAYLFRRINFACENLKLANSNPVQYLCASATVSNPQEFLKSLIGLNFEIVDYEYESSPKHQIDVILLDAPDGGDPYFRMANFINQVSRIENNRTITFVDNRKAVGQIAVIANQLEQNQVYPYRSGYESNDRIQIQQNLAAGTLNGVISTSALEMGIDIGHLNIGILYGVPSSQTSFMQRIGRIGRHQPGFVFVINDKSIRSERIFRNPQNLFNIPLADTALYLDNEFIQYIHALCLVGLQGTAEASALGNQDLENSEVAFPDGFITLCNRVKNSNEPPHLKILSPTGTEVPQLTFPLRDIEKQFKLELEEGRDRTSLGDLTKSQQMREAYPGAVYFHMLSRYRVSAIGNSIITLRNEGHYTTRPILQVLPYPNIQDGLISGKNFSNTAVLECHLDVYEKIFGYYQKIGSQDEKAFNYPNQYFNGRAYSRRIVTTGVLISRGPLTRITSTVKIEAIANIFFNVFLTNIPFEPQDLNFCIGSFNALNNGGLFSSGDNYICIFDKTYGSLRLTSRLMYQDILLASLNSALDWLETAESVYTKDGDEVMIDDEIRTFFTELRDEILGPENPLRHQNAQPTNRAPILDLQQVIKMTNEDADYLIDHVYAQQVNGIVSILYELKNTLTGEELLGIPQSALAVTPQHRIVQFDLNRNRIITE